MIFIPLLILAVVGGGLPIVAGGIAGAMAQGEAERARREREAAEADKLRRTRELARAIIEARGKAIDHYLAARLDTLEQARSAEEEERQRIALVQTRNQTEITAIEAELHRAMDFSWRRPWAHLGSHLLALRTRSVHRDLSEERARLAEKHKARTRNIANCDRESARLAEARNSNLISEANIAAVAGWLTAEGEDGARRRVEESFLLPS